MALYELEEFRRPERPVLVVCMEGWIDAGLGAGTAMRSIQSQIQPELIATFDTDELVDLRARRPTMTITDGVNAEVQWPEIRLQLGKDTSGSDILTLTGPEPDFRWGGFTEDVVELALDLEVRLVVGLGAFPAPFPHTRPVKLTSTATSQALASEAGFMAGTIEVPAGIEAVLEKGFESVGVPAVGLWARVPHYVAGMRYPAASAALIDGLDALAKVSFDASSLRSAAATTHQKVEELISQSEEHLEMVRQLEEQLDAEEGTVPGQLDYIPSGDEIAAELQRYLREQGND